MKKRNNQEHVIWSSNMFLVNKMEGTSFEEEYKKNTQFSADVEEQNVVCRYEPFGLLGFKSTSDMLVAEDNPSYEEDWFFPFHKRY